MRRYRDYNGYLREIFGERVQKIPLDAGMTCPNRDGTLSSKGCVYCDARGSGTGAAFMGGDSVSAQIERAKAFLERRYGARKFLAYFQSFSNTYGPVAKLKDLYGEALSHEGIVGLSVATRPDCVDEDVFRLLASYQQDYLVWLELGLQSSHDETLQRINRGHDAGCFSRAVRRAKAFGLNVCAHIILGLPGETLDMMRETARFLAHLPIDGVKIHSLYVVQGTALAAQYTSGDLETLSRSEYAETVVDVLERLPPHVIVQRLTGDPPREGLLVPLWTREKQINLNFIKASLEKRATWQGRLYG